MIYTVIAVLKYSALVLTGVFGIMGLLVKYKDDDGKITRAGKAALFMILLSTFLAVTLHSLELVKTKRERASAAEERARETLSTVQRTEKLLYEVSRSVYPIKDVHVSYTVRVPMDSEELRGYLERFETELRPSLLTRNTRGIGIMGAGIGLDGSISHVEIGHRSPLVPNKDRERLAFMVLGWSSIRLEFYKSPIAPQDHPSIGGPFEKKPDLSMFLVGGINSRDTLGHTLSYAVGSEQLSLRAARVASEPTSWESTGNIAGVPDLVGSQLFISLPSFMVTGDPKLDQRISEIRSAIELENLAVSIGGRRFVFKPEVMERHKDRKGYTLYVFNFPRTLPELENLARYE